MKWKKAIAKWHETKTSIKLTIFYDNTRELPVARTLYKLINAMKIRYTLVIPNISIRKLHLKICQKNQKKN